MTSTTGKWLVELEKRTDRARLLAAGGQYVYERLRDFSQERVRWRFSTPDEGLERGLLDRADPLIDIALASFAASPTVLTELWRRAAADHYPDPQFRRGIRLACLSNHTVLTDRFPVSIIGAADLERILGAADTEEAYALIRNDKVHDSLLSALFEHREPFAALEDDRWRAFVMQASHNARINDEQEGEFGPNLSQASIQESIFRMLESAPTTGPWVVALHYFLESLDPQQVQEPECSRVDGVLDRWAKVEVLDKDGAIQGGVYPGISYADEFRCLVGALYGSCRKDGDRVVHGSAGAAAIAERCAYYGNAGMTAEEARRFLAREPLVFAFAASCNPALMSRPELRRLIEEGTSGRDFKDRYLSVLGHYQKRWPQHDYRPLAAWLRTEKNESAHAAPAPASAASVAELDQKLARIWTQIQWLQKSAKVAFVGLIALAVLLVVHLALNFR